MKKVVTLLGVAALVGLNGCKLSDNSQRAADNSEKAAQNSTDLLELNQTAFGDGRQGGTRKSRVDALDLLVKAETLENKLVQAGAYYNALEFQLYKADGFREDDASKQERLFQVAVSETTKIIKDFDVIEIDPTKKLSDAITPPGSKTITDATTGESKDIYFGNANYDDARNYAAMAMAMHQLSERQMDAAARYKAQGQKFTAVTFFDVISKILSNKKSCDADPTALNIVPAYVFEGLKVSKDLEKLLQVRMNMMAGTALMVLGSPIKPDPEKGFVVTATAVQIKDATQRLMLAAQARGLLLQSGLSAPMFADVKGGTAQLSAALSKLPPEAGASNSLIPELLKMNAVLKNLL